MSADRPHLHTAPAAPAPMKRLRSLDALRGFDMFWIAGGGALVLAWAGSNDWRWLDHVTAQLEHPEWHGFTAWDLIFPLFLFIAGATLPLSLTRRVEGGAQPRDLHGHVVRRGLTLVFLGVLYNGLLAFDFETLRYASVLGRIGLAWMAAGLIVLHTRPRGQVLWILGLLLGYWAALRWIPVPGYGAGDLAPGHTLTDWVDRHLVPGRLHREVRDPEGVLATLPAVGTALIGALAGTWLRRRDVKDDRRVLGLFCAGALCLAIGGLWDRVFPINKNLWTSSFVLWTAGWSLLLLSIFHLVIDVWGFERWSFFFVVIGANAITIYVLQTFIDFDGVGRLLLAKGAHKLHPVFLAGSGLALKWVLLYWMYRRRIFLRV